MRKAIEWAFDHGTGIALAAIAGLLAAAFGEYAGTLITQASHLFGR